MKKHAYRGGCHTALPIHRKRFEHLYTGRSSDFSASVLPSR